jgi:hypothetical protein
VTFIAHNSLQMIRKFPYLKPLKSLEILQSFIESRVEIMKLLIVLVSLLVFASFGETSEDRVWKPKCRYCLGGAQYTREHINTDACVI